MSTDGKVLLFVQPGFYIRPQELTLLNRKICLSPHPRKLPPIASGD